MSCWEEICTHDEDGILKEWLTLEKFDPNTKDELNITTLQYAVKNGSIKCVKLLLYAPEIDVNFQNLAGETALHFAYRYDDNNTVAYEMRKLLLNSGADKNIKNNFDKRPEACLELGFPELDEIFDILDQSADLLEEEERSADKDFQIYHLREALIDRIMDWTDHNKIIATKLEEPTDNELLLASCINDQEDVLSTILTTGDYDTNFSDKLGNTALHYAAKNGSVDCLELLLSVPDLEADRKNKNGDTALHLAAAYEADLDTAYDMVDLLFGFGASGRIKNNKGLVARECLYPKHDEILEIFDLVEESLEDFIFSDEPTKKAIELPPDNSDDDFGFYDEEYDD